MLQGKVVDHDADVVPLISASEVMGDTEYWVKSQCRIVGRKGSMR
jgi:hypothetical protein